MLKKRTENVRDQEKAEKIEIKILKYFILFLLGPEINLHAILKAKMQPLCSLVVQLNLN